MNTLPSFVGLTMPSPAGRSQHAGILDRVKPPRWHARREGSEGDYRAYLEALRTSDDMIGEMMGISSDWRARGERVIVIVTTDHGREAAFREHGRDHPESARSWVVVSGDGIRESELPSSSEPRALSDLAPTIERLAGIVSTSTDQTGTVMADLIAEPPSAWDRRTLVGAVETRPMRGAASPIVQ